MEKLFKEYKIAIIQHILFYIVGVALIVGLSIFAMNMYLEHETLMWKLVFIGGCGIFLLGLFIEIKNLKTNYLYLLFKDREYVKKKEPVVIKGKIKSYHQIDEKRYSVFYPLLNMANGEQIEVNYYADRKFRESVNKNKIYTFMYLPNSNLTVLVDE